MPSATHGMTRTPEYRVWVSMHQRCGNPNNPAWSNYGSRGITVCERWRSFEHFFSDMGWRPADMLIDRINNDGNYEPANCRWATRSVSNLNRRPRKIKSRPSRQSKMRLFCKNGHPWKPETTIPGRSPRCKICANLALKRHRRKLFHP